MGCDELREDFIRIDKIGQYVQQQIVGNSHEQNRKIIRKRYEIHNNYTTSHTRRVRARTQKNQ
jgi:hypothetical protein